MTIKNIKIIIKMIDITDHIKKIKRGIIKEIKKKTIIIKLVNGTIRIIDKIAGLMINITIEKMIVEIIKKQKKD